MAMKTLLLGIALVLVSCTQPVIEPSEQVIARINGQPVYAKEFLMNYSQLKAEQDEISQKNPKLLDQLKTRALNEVVIMGLLRQEASKKNVLIAREEVEGRLANWKDGYPPGGFEEMLRKTNTTEDYLRKRIEDQLLVEKVLETLFAAETLVSDDELKRQYKANEKEFAKPERVHVFQIVVPTKEEAEKIRAEIASSKITFESAARQYSQSPDASKGGDIGFFAKNEKIPAFNEAFSLSIGTVSKPIQSRYGVHLLKVTEKEPSRKLTYEEARVQIVKALKKQKELRVYKEWVTKLLKDGEIYRNDALYAATH